jgi:uncharacterized membrane protein
MGVPLEFSWISKADDPVEHQLISWEAISGLQNKGRIEFKEIPEEESVDVSMSVEYKLPRILSIVFRLLNLVCYSERCSVDNHRTIGRVPRNLRGARAA